MLFFNILISIIISLYSEIREGFARSSNDGFNGVYFELENLTYFKNIKNL